LADFVDSNEPTAQPPSMNNDMRVVDNMALAINQLVVLGVHAEKR